MAALSPHIATPGDTPQPGQLKLRDKRLSQALKEHRATLKGDPAALKSLQPITERLRYLNRVLSNWDNHHASIAWGQLANGQHEKAALTAFLIFDETDRHTILNAVRDATDGSQYEQDALDAAQRIEQAQELGREVLV